MIERMWERESDLNLGRKSNKLRKFDSILSNTLSLFISFISCSARNLDSIICLYVLFLESKERNKEKEEKSTDLKSHNQQFNFPLKTSLHLSLGSSFIHYGSIDFLCGIRSTKHKIRNGIDKARKRNVNLREKGK